MTRWYSRNRSRLAHALRMAVSSLVAFGFAEALGLPQGFWAVITALIVTQSNVGGSLKAAMDRFAGSLLGAVYGSAIAFAIPHADGVMRALALVLAVAPLSFAAAVSSSFRVAPITAIIVLLSTTGAALGPLGFAMDRVIEVTLGCVVGLLVSVLVVPTRASRTVVGTAGEVVRLLADQLEAMADPGDPEQAGMRALAVQTRQSLGRLETLVGEAAHERRSRLTDMPDPEPLLRTLLRLRNDVVMLRRAIGEPSHEALCTPPAHAWMAVAETSAALLRHVADALSAGQAPRPDDAIARAVGNYRAAVDGMLRSPHTGQPPTDALWRLFGAGFTLEQFRRNFEDLVERSAEFATRR